MTPETVVCIVLTIFVGILWRRFDKLQAEFDAIMQEKIEDELDRD